LSFFHQAIIAGEVPMISKEENGSLIVAEFTSLTEAESWADADPYLINGVYSQVDVRPFKKAFPS